jgi:hypothetical protein
MTVSAQTTDMLVQTLMFRLVVAQLPKRFYSDVRQDTLRFNFTNTAAFFIWGASDRDRHNFEITLTQLSDQESSRTRLLSNELGTFDRTVLLWMESGLDRDVTYQMELKNPLDNKNIVDFRYIQFIDAISE